MEHAGKHALGSYRIDVIMYAIAYTPSQKGGPGGCKARGIEQQTNNQ